MSLAVLNDPRLTFDEATHTYRLHEQRYVSVTQVLALVGLAKFDSPWFSDAVKARGTAVHHAIADDDAGCSLDDVDDLEVLGAVAGWRSFARDTGAVVEFGEQMLCDPSLRIAGRLDYIVSIPDRGGRPVKWLIDLKRALYPCAAIQLAAYVDMAAALYDAPVYFKRAALVLPGDGTYRFHPFGGHLDRATWQAAVRVVTWRREQYGDEC